MFKYVGINNCFEFFISLTNKKYWFQQLQGTYDCRVLTTTEYLRLQSTYDYRVLTATETYDYRVLTTTEYLRLQSTYDYRVLTTTEYLRLQSTYDYKVLTTAACLRLLSINVETFGQFNFFIIPMSLFSTVYA